MRPPPRRGGCLSIGLHNPDIRAAYCEKCFVAILYTSGCKNTLHSYLGINETSGVNGMRIVTSSPVVLYNTILLQHFHNWFCYIYKRLRLIFLSPARHNLRRRMQSPLLFLTQKGKFQDNAQDRPWAGATLHLRGPHKNLKDDLEKLLKGDFLYKQGINQQSLIQAAATLDIAVQFWTFEIEQNQRFFSIVHSTNYFLSSELKPKIDSRTEDD
ncbi:hypothetical protein J6590_027184 [Homalodisca vitripennis]|nr:hypothetical protein J6590_027184 [Homalodisca vitripennis]